jgi:hypothetical protein
MLPTLFRFKLRPALRRRSSPSIRTGAASVRALLSWLLLFVIAPLVVALDAHAVLIATGDGTGNTAPPAADPGFDNVGVIRGLSGVYVRNGWVLTAGHVGAKPILLLGTTYDPVPGSTVGFQNPNMTTADLIAFKLQGKPPLSDLTLATASPTLGTTTTVIGNGLNRGAATTFGSLDGWLWLTTRTIRWGTNDVVGTTQIVLDTQSFITRFDDIPGGPPSQHEADLVSGDSGGGAFTGSGGSAQLMFARGPLPNQPASTSIFGDFGVIVDLFSYRDDILAVIDQPDCSDGLDDDGDGLTDFPNDPGCTDAFDTDERGAAYECDNGLDDDGDGLFDYPDDFGCSSPFDDAELTPTIPTGGYGAAILTLLAAGILAKATRFGPQSPRSVRVG